MRITTHKQSLDESFHETSWSEYWSPSWQPAAAFLWLWFTKRVCLSNLFPYLTHDDSRWAIIHQKSINRIQFKAVKQAATNCASHSIIRLINQQYTQSSTVFMMVPQQQKYIFLRSCGTWKINICVENWFRRSQSKRRTVNGFWVIIGGSLTPFSPLIPHLNPICLNDYDRCKIYELFSFQFPDRLEKKQKQNKHEEDEVWGRKATATKTRTIRKFFLLVFITFSSVCGLFVQMGKHLFTLKLLNV